MKRWLLLPLGFALGVAASGLMASASPSSSLSGELRIDVTQEVIKLDKYTDVNFRVDFPVTLYKEEWQYNMGYIDIENNTEGLVRIDDVRCAHPVGDFCPTMETTLPYYINADGFGSIRLKWEVPSDFNRADNNVEIVIDYWVEKPARPMWEIHFPLIMKNYRPK